LHRAPAAATPAAAPTPSPATPVERAPVVVAAPEPAPEPVVVAEPEPAPEPAVVAEPEPASPVAADPVAEPVTAPSPVSPIAGDIAGMLDESAIEFELVDPDASDEVPPVVEPPVPVEAVVPPPPAHIETDATTAPSAVVDDTPPPVAAQVVPLRPVPRQDARHDGPARSLARHDGLERLLRLAVARGASALYLTTQAPPALRADGEVQMLGGEPPLTSEDVEAAILEILPDGVSEAASRGEATEWIRDLPDIGRVRCTTFRDYRGPGALLRMISARAASAEQLGLSREIQALATETEGLVLVSGPRGSGKSTLVAAVVDLINRQRADYVVTLERQIRLVHESRHSLISQREVRGHGEEVAAAARAALRENPDVLVIEDLRSPETLQVALDAAGSGLLVVLSVTASATTAALERLVDMVPAERRAPVQAALAETLRGAMSQVLLRKATGGRVAARELLLNTAAVARLLAEGQLSQVPRALDGGRKHGMTPLNDTLVSLVQGGVVDVREAYRKAADREGLLAQLKRAGLDTSFVERLA
ncbi:MAG: type IV pilus twitching motility protein PilT, partial [Vicinamibacteria bacterium]